MGERMGREVGIIPEVKEPAFHRREGKPIESVLVETLKEAGYDDKYGACMIQCFDLDALRRMSEMTKTKLVYLINEPPTLKDRELAPRICTAVGIPWSMAVNDAGQLTEIAEELSARGLYLLLWTFGDHAEQTRQAFATPLVRGLFTNNPDVAIRVRDATITPGSDRPRTGSSAP
jgi:glycerophosphoryl diester phosphodiesterase